MDNAQKLRIGILGLGPICQAAHLEAVRRAQLTELVAICDVAEDLCKHFSQVHHVPTYYTSYEEMLKNPDIDAIVIGTAHEYHVKFARMAIAAGKHVLCEKPLGIDIKECETLRDEIKSSGLTFRVGHMKRFDPGIEFAKQFIHDELGKVAAIQAWYCADIYMHDYCNNLQPIIERSVDAQVSTYKQQKDYETYKLLDHCSHLLDTAIYLCGPIQSLQARHTSVDDLSCWQIAINYENGIIGTLDYSLTIRMDWREGFLVYGQNGSVQAKTYNPWYFKASEVETYLASSGNYTRPIAIDGHVFKRQLQSFAHEILQGGRKQGADIDDGIAVVRCIAAIKKSIAENRLVNLSEVEGGI